MGSVARFISARELLAMESPRRPEVPVTEHYRERDLTWTLLCELEPRLRTLEREARDSRQRSVRTWHRLFKPQITAVVGWEREDPDPTGGVLCGTIAYDLAYAHLSGLLRTRRSRVKLRRV